MSTDTLFVRRFLTDYARNPVNLLFLVLVPVVFVVVAAGSMADAAKLLGGPGGPAVETATAGWAAGFLAGIAMYFQTAGSHDADRRLTQAGLAPGRLVTARLLTGLILAATAAAAALLALAARTGIDQPARVAAGTLMFAVIYLAIGALVGALVRNPVNGTVLILFVWILDVFFGPALGSADRLATRALPRTSSRSGWPMCPPGTAAESATWAGRCSGPSARPRSAGRWSPPPAAASPSRRDEADPVRSATSSVPACGCGCERPAATRCCGCCSSSCRSCSCCWPTRSRHTGRKH